MATDLQLHPSQELHLLVKVLGASRALIADLHLMAFGARPFCCHSAGAP